ncbi:MAG TPA: molybdopterin cofactor-binding domain-containing protein, partial [Steroidobacteraceae bacterium]|nr:molybdopterin cofactor-binding domain-containing protein [Steroidobacteraceae bacterium]
YKWIGKNIPRRDIPKKFTGGAAYVHDLRLPGMIFGRVVRPPSPGATLVSFDEAAIRQMPGVIVVVRDGNFLGIAAEREEQAVRASEALRKTAVWKETESLPSIEHLHEQMMQLPVKPVTVTEKNTPSASPAKTLTALYTRPFLVHGSLGPSCAVARWDTKETGDTLQVYTHSQGVFPLRAELAKAFNIDQTLIRCTHVEGSGCYGHNGADDVAFDAALIARAIPDRPVKLQWMRDDEFMWEPYGSAMAMKMDASLDANGNVAQWSHELWSHSHSTRPGSSRGVNLLAARHLEKPLPVELPTEGVPPAGASDRNSVPLYDFPNVKVTKHFIPETALRTSALRTLGGYANVFALESFMDELATAANIDPVDFRLRHMKDDRARAVIEAAARRANWKPKHRGDGTNGWGFAFAKYKNLACYCAIAVNVRVDRRAGNVRVLQAVAAVDAGQVVSPDGVTNQIEGGIIQSTSWTLKEAVNFDRTRVTTRSWSDYPILRFDEVPQVEVTILDHPEQPSLGVGEASQGPAAAAIANAIANATGKRLRALPFTPDRMKQAFS